MEGPEPLCYECKHFDRYSIDILICTAYPKGIPDEILDGKIIHKKPYKGDNGIQFEKKGGD